MLCGLHNGKIKFKSGRLLRRGGQRRGIPGDKEALIILRCLIKDTRLWFIY